MSDGIINSDKEVTNPNPTKSTPQQQVRQVPAQPQDRQRMLQQAQQQVRQIPVQPQDRQRMLQQMQAQQQARQATAQPQDRQRMLQQMQAQQQARQATAQPQDRQRMLQQMQAQQQARQVANPSLAQQRPMAQSAGMLQQQAGVKPAEQVNLNKSASSVVPTATGNPVDILESARRAAAQKRASENAPASGRLRMSAASAGLLSELRANTSSIPQRQNVAPAIQNIKVDDPSISDEVDRLLKQINEFHEISDKLNEEIDVLKRQQSQMTQFITVFFNQDTVENALDTIFSSLKHHMKCDALEFMYLDEPQGLIFLYSLTNDGIFQWEDYVSYKGTDFEPVIAAQQPDVVNDLSLKADYPVSGIAEAFGLKSLLRVPCASAESFVGYLNIFAKEASAYGDEEKQKAATYAIATAFFFENMFLKEKLSYIRKSSRPKPDRDFLNMTEYLKQQFEQPLDEITDNADNALKPKNGKLSPKQYEFLQNIKDEVAFIKKCSFYLKEYLEFTADQKQPSIARVDTKKLIKDIDKRMKEAVESKSARLMIEWILPENEKNPPQILADYNWMLRILLALLQNALDATEINKPFKLLVDCRNDPNYVEFAVYDTGKEPIMSGDYTNIFTPFGTLSTKANKKKTRLFLNLPLVKMYVERMEGTITVDSQKEDTMFSVKIPIGRRR